MEKAKSRKFFKKVASYCILIIIIISPPLKTSYSDSNEDNDLRTNNTGRTVMSE